MSYKTVFQGGEGEYIEKKSRFIAAIAPARTEEEALAFIAGIKKKHYAARHNCFAYVLGADGAQMRASDDGEPQGTAGRPMLDTLTGNGLTDTVAVVTRYFGGTLLGTGGLVRAYTQAMQAGLAACRIIEKKQGVRLRIRIDYHGLGKLQYWLEQNGIQILDAVYETEVTMELIVPVEKENDVCRSVSEMSGGKAHIENLGSLFFSELDGKILPE